MKRYRVSFEMEAPETFPGDRLPALPKDGKWFGRMLAKPIASVRRMNGGRVEEVTYKIRGGVRVEAV